MYMQNIYSQLVYSQCITYYCDYYNLMEKYVDTILKGEDSRLRI